MNKGYITVLGYALFLMGFLSILFTIVGLQLTFLSWISAFGPGVAIVIKLVMLFSGLIIMFISKFPPQDDEE